MKKTLLLAGLLLALTASVAMAAGISVSWGNNCWADAGHASNLTWACNSNTYTGIRMTASFKPAETKDNLVATDLYFEGMTEAASVPSFWALGEGGCRYSGTAVTLSADGSAFPGGCIDTWGGAGGGGIGAYSSNDTRMHINATWAVADAIPVEAEAEYFSAQVRITAAKTVGTACPGCAIPAIWALNYIQLGFLGEAMPVVLDFPYAGGNQCLTWQGSTLPCLKPVPARNTTWGQVKSLYR